MKHYILNLLLVIVLIGTMSCSEEVQVDKKEVMPQKEIVHCQAH